MFILQGIMQTCRDSRAPACRTRAPVRAWNAKALTTNRLSGAFILALIFGALSLVAGMMGCAGPASLPATAPPEAARLALSPPALSPTPSGPIILSVWHRWPEAQAATVRELLDNYQSSRPNVRVELAYKADLYDSLQQAKEVGPMPDVIAMPGDRIAEYVAAGVLEPLDIYIDASWLEESFLSPALDALRFQGKLWGLPLHLQTVTFIYNTRLIQDEELSAQTAELLAKARAYQASHAGIWYLVYPARDDMYFAAPWFYGAGAWYVDEKGQVGLNTPAGLEAAAFLASLREIMPPDIDLGKADALFKAGQAAITVNGPWYLPELEAAGIPYALQLMPTVSSSRQPARPLVSVEGLMLGSEPKHVEEAVRLIAYLAGSESELRLARKHGLIPANLLAIQRANEEGLVVIYHFAKQAELGVGMPTTPYLGATYGPVSQLLQALWNGTPPPVALQLAQEEILKAIR